VLTVGWEYYIQEPHNRQFKPKAYATNFNYCTPNTPSRSYANPPSQRLQN
jgi:hypothetical protein